MLLSQSKMKIKGCGYSTNILKGFITSSRQVFFCCFFFVLKLIKIKYKKPIKLNYNRKRKEKKEDFQMIQTIQERSTKKQRKSTVAIQVKMKNQKEKTEAEVLAQAGVPKSVSP